MSNDGPVDEILDLITGEAANPKNQGVLDGTRSGGDRRQEAGRAAGESSARRRPTSPNEPDGGLTMRDLADQADDDGRAQRGPLLGASEGDDSSP